MGPARRAGFGSQIDRREQHVGEVWHPLGAPRAGRRFRCHITGVPGVQHAGNPERHPSEHVAVGGHDGVVGFDLRTEAFADAAPVRPQVLAHPDPSIAEVEGNTQASGRLPAKRCRTSPA